MALNLFGVTLNDGHQGELAAGVELVSVRELAAICGTTEYRAVEPSDQIVRQYSDTVSAFLSHGPVLPAPVGIVFRAADSVRRWLELHYSALTDALAYVDNRVAARVHVRPAPLEVGATADANAGSVAMESLRALRRAAIATLPLRLDKMSGILASSAFLVDEMTWKEFEAEVEAQAKLVPSVVFEVTGPWPPYDFVKMQLGA